MGFDFSNASDATTDPLSFFCDRGEDYEQYRPIHPAAAIDAIVSGLLPSALVAADVGAGTGIGSRLLAERGIRVWAIEPNSDMRSAATPHERVEFLVGTAEQIPLETASVDLVTSFQAFHWFDFTKSLQEFRRILKPGGRLALIWSLWDPRDPVSREYMRLIFEASRKQEQQSQAGKRSKGWGDRLRYQLFWRGLWLPDFTNFQRQEFQFCQSLDLRGLVGLARSQGFTPSQGAALENLISELSHFHRQFADAQGHVSLAYRTRLYLASTAHS